MKTYMPRYESPEHAKLQPLFPGYLFVLPGDKWHKLRSTYGVIDIVMVGGKPAFVPTLVLKDLQSRANKEGIVVLEEQRAPEKGEAVQIKKGAFKGFNGIYNGLNDRGRVEVLLSLFGKDATIELDKAKYVELVDATRKPPPVSKAGAVATNKTKSEATPCRSQTSK